MSRITLSERRNSELVGNDAELIFGQSGNRNRNQNEVDFCIERNRSGEERLRFARPF